MYKNLEAELSRNGLTKGELARLLNIQPTTLSNKLNGKAELKFSEAIRIKAILKVDLPLEVLFSA